MRDRYKKTRKNALSLSFRFNSLLSQKLKNEKKFTTYYFFFFSWHCIKNKIYGGNIFEFFWKKKR